MMAIDELPKLDLRGDSTSEVSLWSRRVVACFGERPVDQALQKILGHRDDTFLGTRERLSIASELSDLCVFVTTAPNMH